MPLDATCRRARGNAGGAIRRDALDAGAVASGAKIKPGEALHREPLVTAARFKTAFCLGIYVLDSLRLGHDSLLEIRDLASRNDKGLMACEGISLAVRGGEILAVAGVAGNGQRELVEVLAGQREPEAGEIRVAGARAARSSNQETSTGEPKLLRRSDGRSVVVQ